ncbi:MaoC family dehydratase [Cupriavidus necator]|uniref:Dehydratase n=1 Tax=Cupriavidus necator TaxID=106590 RepID=A0A367PHX9_CUPNE|nr:MaoC family dehydratase [Cupriavidus necator]QQX82782.1 MaoC family dehydratase [Cupriavidus necator]RCJ07478.1 dehydratase [Cupriavidus necator]
MTTRALKDYHVGDAIPPLQLPPISRTTLALYAGASGDHHPLHIDLDFARNAGLDDVFAHGMLSTAYVARLVTDWVGQDQLRDLKVRFTGITHLRDAPLCTGRITGRFEANGETRLRVEITCANQAGEAKIVGEAVVGVP